MFLFQVCMEPARDKQPLSAAGQLIKSLALLRPGRLVALLTQRITAASLAFLRQVGSTAVALL